MLRRKKKANEWRKDMKKQEIRNEEGVWEETGKKKDLAGKLLSPA